MEPSGASRRSPDRTEGSRLTHLADSTASPRLRRVAITTLLAEARMSSVDKPNINALAELSSMLSDAVKRAASYIVAIHARRRIPSSGVVWRDGIIVSASHTVRRDGTVRITLPDGNNAEASVVGRDAVTDLVVLRAPDLSLAAAPRAESRASAVGSLVLAVGRPGRNVSASFGIVSAVREGWRTETGDRIDGL